MSGAPAQVDRRRGPVPEPKLFCLTLTTWIYIVLIALLVIDCVEFAFSNTFDSVPVYHTIANALTIIVTAVILVFGTKWSLRLAQILNILQIISRLVFLGIVIRDLATNDEDHDFFGPGTSKTHEHPVIISYVVATIVQLPGNFALIFLVFKLYRTVFPEQLVPGLLCFII